MTYGISLMYMDCYRYLFPVYNCPVRPVGYVDYAGYVLAYSSRQRPYCQHGTNGELLQYAEDNKLSCRWQTARCICAIRNGMADPGINTPLRHMCYHAEFGCCS